jgi:hypothetical protein
MFGLKSGTFLDIERVWKVKLTELISGNTPALGYLS